MNRCTCRVAKAGDLDVARGHRDVGDKVVCAGHRALVVIKKIIANGSNTMTTSTIGHETGAYGGDRDQEILERLRRMETRGNAFYRHMGHNPKRKDRVREATVIVNNGAIEVTGADVTIGEISNAANAARLTGDVPMYVNGNYWGNVDV